MRLNHGLHLAYCTNIHRGETWAETFAALQTYALAVRERVCPHAPYGLGLRLSHVAARELSEPGTLTAFQRWLAAQSCYVFTINGFPYGQFHGGRVKEQVYQPDWTTPERLAYTNLLFDLLARLVPDGVAGRVSTHREAVSRELSRLISIGLLPAFADFKGRGSALFSLTSAIIAPPGPKWNGDLAETFLCHACRQRPKILSGQEGSVADRGKVTGTIPARK